MTEENYLNDKVRGIVEPMINSLLTTCPEEPMRYMLTWLINYTNGQSFTINGEREELERLRKEVRRYKKKIKKTIPKKRRKKNRKKTIRTTYFIRKCL